MLKNGDMLYNSGDTFCTCTYYILYKIQWNPSITDTIGTSKLVLLMELSFVEGSFKIIEIICNYMYMYMYM